MAYDYNKYKSVYEGLNDDQRQKWDTKYGNTEQYKQFKADYEKETNNTPQQNTNTANFNNQNGTNGQSSTQNQTPTIQKTETQTNNQSYNYDPQEELDKSMFQPSSGKVTVKEGTAAQTGMPDYQAESEARNREITDNLNYYWENNKDYFSTREKFNNIFHYNERNDSQKAILDSYWKKKEDVDYVSQFNSGESLYRGMNNGQVTTDQLNLLKETDPKAYQAWQEKQEEEIKKRIINDIVPPVMEEISTNMINMMNNLGIQPQDALDIEGIYNSTMTELGAYQTLADANNTVKKIEEVINKKTAIMNRYASSTGGTVSDALAAARMQKALAPYNEQLNGLQYQYQDYANLYNQKLATATQAAQVRQAQAQENQRVWQQRLTALGFAADAMSYRTPEQQAQLKLQTQQAMNEMDLLYQSRMQDLNRYNTYATTKLQNQLQSELTDLSVEDQEQLRANLNNVLNTYYDEWGAIIQRPQSEVIDDVLDYAKKNGVTVAEALRKNFIEPLQSKREYKTKVAEEYGLNKYQQQYSYTIDEDGNISITATGYGQIPQDAFKTRASRQAAYEDVYDYSNTWADYVQNLAGSIKDGSYGGQCGAFCNDVLIAGGDSKIFGDTLEQKIKACNVKKEDGPQVGYAVVFDLGFMSKDGKNHGHVGIVSAVNGDGSIDVLESNGKSDETIHVKRYSKAAVDKMVMGYYKPSNYDIQKEVKSVYQEEASSSPYVGVSNYTSTGAEINSGGWITDLEDTFLSTTRMSDAERKELYSAYGIDTKQYNAMKKKYVDYQAKVTLIEDAQQMYDAVKDLLEWNQKYSSSGVGTRHKGQIDEATYNTVYNGAATEHFWWGQSKFDKETANGVAKYKYIKDNKILERYQELKKNGATFGQMSNSEWGLVGDAATSLNRRGTDDQFESNLKNMLNSYANILAEAGVEGFYNTDI